MSGFFASAETSMMSLNRYRLKYLKNSGHRGAQRASAMLDRTDRLIGLILIGNNLVNILASAIATVVAIRLWGDAGIAIATILLTLVILIFAEITPKTIAALHPEKIAFPASLLLLPLMKLLYPVVWLVNCITNAMLKRVGVNAEQQRELAITSEELHTLVSDAGRLIPNNHQNMLLSILELERVTVDHILIPRNEVYGIDLSESDAAILHTIQNSEYTRLPVYNGDINNIRGLLHIRNVSRFMGADGLDRRRMDNYVEPPYFIPEGTALNRQLLNFQRSKHRMAVVVDEYGDVRGLVALEDILEEIVGEFTSNLAETMDDIYPQQDGSYLIDGTATIRDINKTLEWELPTTGAKTLNGLMLEYLEGFPDGNAGVELGNCYLEILNLRDNVIQSVRARPVL